MTILVSESWKSGTLRKLKDVIHRKEMTIPHNFLEPIRVLWLILSLKSFPRMTLLRATWYSLYKNMRHLPVGFRGFG